MMNEPDKHWMRWPLAAWEGLLFGWFLFMGHVAVGHLIQIAEYAGHSVPNERRPRLTIWMQNVFPEETWSLLTGIAAFSIGFGLINLTSNEAPSSRLFRWTVIAALTMIVGVSLPIMAAFTHLSGGLDERMWDEVLFVGLALSTLAYGIIRVRRHNRHQA